MTLLQIVNEVVTAEGVDNLVKMSSKIGFRILIDMLSVLILVRYIYFPIYKHREFFFMFVIFNLIIFLVYLPETTGAVYFDDVSLTVN